MPARGEIGGEIGGEIIRSFLGGCRFQQPPSQLLMSYYTIHKLARNHSKRVLQILHVWSFFQLRKVFFIQEVQFAERMLLSPAEREIAEKRRIMLEAYNRKSSLLTTRSQSKLDLLEKETRISPLSPIKRPTEKKFNHAKGCTLAANGQMPPKITRKWWLQKPSAPGEKCNKTQMKLANPTYFTGTNKYRNYEPEADRMHYRAERLMSHESTGHNAANVQADLFLRLQLRESCND